MARTSRLPGFYKVSVDERRALVGDATGADPRHIANALEEGGLDAATADKFVENVLGTYALPYGVALNVRVNGHDYVVPMVVEEPSVVAAASNAAKMIREGGGFIAEMDPPLMIAQMQLTGVRERPAAMARVLAAKDELLVLADRAIPGLVERGGGARDVEVRRARGQTTTGCSSSTSSSTAATRWARTSSTPSPRPCAAARRARRRAHRAAHPLEPLRPALRARALPRARPGARDGRDGRRGRHRRHRQRVALRRARPVPRRHAQQGHHERRRRGGHRHRQRLARGRGRRARLRRAHRALLAARDVAA